MGLGEYFARRVFSHLNERGQFGKKISRRRDVVTIRDIDFHIGVSGRELDVLIEPHKDYEDFEEYIKSTQTKDFWEKEFLAGLKRRRKKNREFLRNPRVEKNGNENYHFKAEFTRQNPDKRFLVVLNYGIRPFMLFGLPISQ